MRCSRYTIALLAPVLALVFAASATAAPTDLDTTFSGDGRMVDSTLFSQEAIYATAVQADGKIVTVGADNGSQEWLIMRFNTDGTLDSTFDGPSGTGDGKFEIDPSTSYDAAFDVAIVPATQRIVVAGRVRNTTTGKTEFGVVRLNTNGTIDSGFNGGSVKSFEIDEDASGQDAYVESVALDGAKIVVGGWAYDGVGNGQADFAIARLENDGDLDPTIDGDGTALRSMTAATFDYLTDIFVDASGNIITFGTTSEPGFPTRRVLVAARFTSAGSIDPTFNPTGSSPGKSYATSITGFAGRAVKRSTGEFVLVGTTNAAPDDCLVVQYTATGEIDTTFSGDGYQTVDFKGGLDFCMEVAEDADGKLLISGMTKDDSFRGNAALARLTTSGALDTTFDPDGKLIANWTAGNDQFTTVDVLSGGKILVGGFEGSDGGGASGAVLAQYVGGSGGFTPPTRPADLALDTTFDSDGRVRSDWSAGRDDIASGVAIGGDGSIFAVGAYEVLYSASPLTYLPDAAVAKYSPNGQPDPSFDGDGIATFSPTDPPATATSVFSFQDAAVLSDGSLLVCGSVSFSGAGAEVLIAKFTPTGALDTSFDTDGWAFYDIEYTAAGLTIHALPGDGAIVTGSAGNTFYPKMFAMKVDSSGQYDSGFGTAGVQMVDFDPSGAEEALDSALLSDGSLMLAGYSEASGDRDTAIAKLDSLGQPDTSYDGDGELTLQVGTGDSQANGIDVQADDNVVIAGEAFDGALTKDAFAARVKTDATLDATGFASGGVAFVPFGTEDDSGTDVTVDPVDGNVTLGGRANYGIDDDFAFARFDGAGNPLSAFDGDGYGSTQIGTDMDLVYEIETDPSRRVVAVGTASDGGLRDFSLTRLPAPPGAAPAPGGGDPPAAQPLAAGSSKISSPVHNRKYTAKRFKKLKGTASSVNVADPVTKVEIALRRVDSKRCYWLSSSKAKFRRSGMKSKKCPTLRWVKVSGTTSWSLKLRKSLPKDSYELYSRVTLASGTVETNFKTKTNKVRFKLR